MELHELEHKTVNDLREMAAKYDDIDGVSGLKKQQLVDALCEKLGIDQHVHVPEGIGRRKLKERIGALKKRRTEALGASDRKALGEVRREIKSNKRRLRRIIQRAVLRESGAAKKQAPEAG